MKDLEARFAEVEKRVKTLISDNSRLKKQVSELERELAQARLQSGELQNYHGKRLHIKEKIEAILQSLEAAGKKST